MKAKQIILRCPYRTKEETRVERGNYFEDQVKITHFLPCYKEECGFWDNNKQICSLNRKEIE